MVPLTELSDTEIPTWAIGVGDLDGRIYSTSSAVNPFSGTYDLWGDIFKFPISNLFPYIGDFRRKDRCLFICAAAGDLWFEMLLVIFVLLLLLLLLFCHFLLFRFIVRRWVVKEVICRRLFASITFDKGPQNLLLRESSQILESADCFELFWWNSYVAFWNWSGTALHLLVCCGSLRVVVNLHNQLHESLWILLNSLE